MESTEYLPHIAYDSVIFGFSGEKLKILLLEYHNTGFFALPGGFVHKYENLNEAAKRGLQERTGLNNIYLEALDYFEIDFLDDDYLPSIIENSCEIIDFIILKLK